MFSLIIVIVSIALVVALVAVTMYRGGDFLSQGRVEARAAQIVNEAQQIKGALARFKVENQNVQLNTLDELAPKYLTAVPQGWNTAHGITGLENHIVIAVPGDEADQLLACEKANERMGLPPEPPQCSTVSATFTGCCVVPD